LFPMFYMPMPLSPPMPEQPQMAGQDATGAPIQSLPGMPVNPQVGQQPVNMPEPTIEQQLGLSGPVQPTSGV
jgi:hypothetical protein